MGYLLTLEAPDASGKSTQAHLLCENLRRAGIPVRTVRFPNYGSDACKPVELYLSGALGARPEDTGAYAASVFFAVDRYVSYRTDWKQDLEKPDGVVLLDRYTTSNAIHQLAKLRSPAEKTAFLDWLYDFEFTKLALPVPDDTLFLDVPPKTSLALLKSRAASDFSHVTDIHEADEAYLSRCYEAACFAADAKGWRRIPCTQNGLMRPISDIGEEIFSYVLERIKEKTARL